MVLIIRSVKMDDLEAIVKLESAAFNMSETMTRKDMIGRIVNYPDTFLVAEKDGQVIGHLFGPAFNKRYIEDELYFQNYPNRAKDQYQMILGLAVLPEYRKKGVATKLLTNMDLVAREAGRIAISLTCLPKLFNFYEKRSFQNEGKTSDNIPDPEGISSYNMVKKLV